MMKRSTTPLASKSRSTVVFDPLGISSTPTSPVLAKSPRPTHPALGSALGSAHYAHSAHSSVDDYNVVEESEQFKKLPRGKISKYHFSPRSSITAASLASFSSNVDKGTKEAGSGHSDDIVSEVQLKQRLKHRQDTFFKRVGHQLKSSSTFLLAHIRGSISKTSNASFSKSQSRLAPLTPIASRQQSALSSRRPSCITPSNTQQKRQSIVKFNLQDDDDHDRYSLCEEDPGNKDLWCMFIANLCFLAAVGLLVTVLHLHGVIDVTCL